LLYFVHVTKKVIVACLCAFFSCRFSQRQRLPGARVHAPPAPAGLREGAMHAGRRCGARWSELGWAWSVWTLLGVN
jgi:hypothetical protein